MLTVVDWRISMTPQPPQYVLVPRPTSGLATASLVLGILSTFLCCFTGLPAVIFGHVGLLEIRKSGTMMEGRGMAIGGMVLGYISLLPVLIYTVVMVTGIGLSIPAILIERSNHPVVRAPDRYAAARPVVVALRAYAVSHQNQLPPDLESLVREHYLQQSALALLASDHLARDSSVGNTPQPSGWNYIGAGKRLPDADHLIVLESRFTNEIDRQLMIGLNGHTTEGPFVKPQSRASP